MAQCYDYLYEMESVKGGRRLVSGRADGGWRNVMTYTTVMSDDNQASSITVWHAKESEYYSEHS